MSSSTFYTQDTFPSTFISSWAYQEPHTQYESDLSTLIDPALGDTDLSGLEADILPLSASVETTHLLEGGYTVQKDIDGLSKRIVNLEKVLLNNDICLADVATEVADQGRCLSQASQKIDSMAEKLSGLAKTVDQLISTVNGLATTTGELVESEQHAMEKFRRLVGDLGGPPTSTSHTARRNGAADITP
ncbi:uncharacterized protein CDV56_103921 [Aspergillus thermomutatus]|uniref:Uncharacterized protein n=1 Tax=Aspergillus thermomutatus TaxID=41047 RepID=A0A397GL95_ASPTH|nr:uncharacterized protein CDV56_103921 [Aspergillus thermomutatus]RHZ48750.1 hypothetical protein CDV56_103921 [Aspergillus thermomutatus]